jgi:integrase/recombinase XerD
MNSTDLRQRLDAYLKLRKQLGFHIQAEESYLADFVRYLEQHWPGARQTAQLAVEWACSAGSRGPASQARRLSFARRFLMHLRASLPEITIPGPHLLAGPRRSAPHIYSTAELQSLLKAARALGPPGSLRPLTYATLIGLLASCGLRASEALRLRVGDVVLAAAPAHLCVRQTKFRKSRLVPLHQTTVEAMRNYAVARARLSKPDSSACFFISEKKTPLNYHTVARTFVALAHQVGIREPQSKWGASLHDLRHTFAVRRMEAWYRQGVDVQAQLPELAVYLGHVRPEDTYWYLTATAELLSLAAERFERYHQAGGAL